MNLGATKQKHINCDIPSFAIYPCYMQCERGWDESKCSKIVTKDLSFLDCVQMLSGYAYLIISFSHTPVQMEHICLFIFLKVN